MKYGIIFDLDGTLWEVIESTYKSVNEVARKYKLAGISKDTICACFGLNKEETAKRYFPNLNQEYRLKLLDEIALINIKNLRSNGGNLYSGILVCDFFWIIILILLSLVKANLLFFSPIIFTIGFLSFILCLSV